MVEGTIRAINLAEHSAVVETRDGQTLNVKFGPDSNFEVYEPATAGTRGGTLEDVGIGYLVQLDIHPLQDTESCHCSSLLSIS